MVKEPFGQIVNQFFFGSERVWNGRVIKYPLAGVVHVFDPVAAFDGAIVDDVVDITFFQIHCLTRLANVVVVFIICLSFIVFIVLDGFVSNQH